MMWLQVQLLSGLSGDWGERGGTLGRRVGVLMSGQGETI